MSLRTLDVALGILAIVLIRSFYNAVTAKAKLPLPPGPKGRPLIGNLLDMPMVDQWFTFAEWGKRWGDICSLTIFGQTIIIVNSSKVASDLMEKRSSNYSDRPVLQMGGRLVGWDKTFILTQAGSTIHRTGRTYFTRLMGSIDALKMYFPAQEMEARRLLHRLAEQPNTLPQQLRMFTGSLILRIIYGYETQDQNDHFLKLTETVNDQMTLSTTPGVWLVDSVPALHYVPSWMPGIKFKNIAAEYARNLRQIVEEPFNYVKTQMAAGNAPPSFLENLLSDKLNPSPEEEHSFKWASFTFNAAGTDTTLIQLYSFFLAMILHPHAMHKAQAEIDALTSGERLPTFEDKDQLPYLSALVTEVFRWHTVAPLGVAHQSKEDDHYQGYLIPKGSIIISNQWQMAHDPNVYKSPMTFDPERFLGPEPESTDPVWFGFGRRICPGQHFANAEVWIACAVALAVLDITKAVDEDGKPVTPVHEMMQGNVSYPKPFSYCIRPRSEAAAALIQAIAEE